MTVTWPTSKEYAHNCYGTLVILPLSCLVALKLPRHPFNNKKKILKFDLTHS